MTNYTELKRLAEALDEIKTVSSVADCEKFNAFFRAITPGTVLALIAESKRLKSDLNESNDLVEHLGDKRKALTAERDQLKAENDGNAKDFLAFGVVMRSQADKVDQLKAENAGLKTGYEAYERVNAELKAENEALRKILTECADSLHGEMLQKFGGQLPDDMHPVMRREYDRDMTEVAGYRAALGKGEQS